MEITLTLKLIAISLVILQRKIKHDSLNEQRFWFNSYDYIVVGAGSAGCVVAARLAEDITKTVLLLEAGGPQTTESDIPAKQQSLFETDLDWNYPMVPQQNAYFAKTDRQTNITRGRVFGGSSVLNRMNYYRDSPEYFDLWDLELGIKNWTFDDVLPYFLKSENNLDPKIVEQSNELHRTGGELSISTAIPDRILEEYVKAAQKLGYSETFTDGRNPFGYTIMQRTIKNGVRQSSSVAFLESKIRFNLHLLGNSLVTKILFNGQKRANGVTFRRHGCNFTIQARKEVILSAGVIGSPQLLMLSGIGPKKHLLDLKIPLISNSRVGDNMLQAIFVELNFDIKNQSEIQKPIENIDNKYAYYVEGRGPLAYKSSGATCFREVAYDKNPSISNGCVLPRLEFLSEDLENLVENHVLRNEWQKYYRPYLGRAFFELYAVIRRPKSNGTIRLRSNNPFDKPLIDPCIFCNPSDLDIMAETIRLSLDIFQSPYFQEFVEIYKNAIPGCDPCPGSYFCNSYLRCIAQTMTSFIAPIGTCRIGHINDEKAVVDEKLRVKGVSALRVIDSSVIPFTTDQTYAITIMIGERGAQFVKDDNF